MPFWINKQLLFFSVGVKLGCLLTGQVGCLVEVLLYVHRNRRLIRDGSPTTATSTFTQLLSSDRTGRLLLFLKTSFALM